MAAASSGSTVICGGGPPSAKVAVCGSQWPAAASMARPSISPVIVVPSLVKRACLVP